MNRIFLSFLCVLTLASCKKTSQSRDEYLAAMDDSIHTESLIFWTSDTGIADKVNRIQTIEDFLHIKFPDIEETIFAKYANLNKEKEVE